MRTRVQIFRIPSITKKMPLFHFASPQLYFLLQVTPATVDSCFSSNKYIGSCASLLTRRDGADAEVILVRSSTEHLRRMQVLFGYLDALERLILKTEICEAAHVAFQKLLAYIIELERQRSQGEMAVAAQLAALQARLVDMVNSIECMWTWMYSCIR